MHVKDAVIKELLDLRRKAIGMRNYSVNTSKKLCTPKIHDKRLQKVWMYEEIIYDLECHIYERYRQLGLLPPKRWVRT